MTLPIIQPASMDVNPFQQAGVNFTGVNVLISSDLRSDMAVLSKAQHRYKKRKMNISASEQKREEEAAMKLGQVKKIYPPVLHMQVPFQVRSVPKEACMLWCLPIQRCSKCSHALCRYNPCHKGFLFARLYC